VIELHPLPSSIVKTCTNCPRRFGRAGKEDCWRLRGKWKFDKEHRFLFIDKVVGGAIPREFIAPVEAGIAKRSTMACLQVYDGGRRCGFGRRQLSRCRLERMAFKIAGSMAFKKACSKAKPVLLEPIMKVEVVVPEEYMAAVFGDLNSRRPRFRERKAAQAAT